MRKWMNLCESVETAPHFTYNAREGEYEFSGFNCYATAMGGDMDEDGQPTGGVNIMSFTSGTKGQGNGEKALRWMKAQGLHIMADDIGYPDENPDSFGFWKSMADKGIVDVLLDGDGNQIFHDGRWDIPEEDEDRYEGR